MTLTWGIVPDGTAIAGFAGEPGNPSNLIARMDGIYGAGPGGADLTLRPWFTHYQSVFDNWASLTGIRYVYETNDDGAPLAFNAGALGLRADVRIGGHLIDGTGGILAYNFFPDTSDMVIDTADNVYLNTFANSRILRNILAHEHGHGLGINHICPVNARWLMEPFLATGFDGPQADDILAANRGYGDPDEFPMENDIYADATALGALPAGTDVTRSRRSIDGTSDEDWYTFGLPAGAKVTVTATPTGSTYNSGPQNPNGSCTAGTPFDSLRQSDLTLELIGTDGFTVLATGNAGGPGVAESVTSRVPNVPVTYAARIAGDTNAAQMYDLRLQVEDVAPPVISCNVLRSLLWPARKGLIPVGLSASANDAIDGAVPVTITVYSDEAQGTAPFAPDALHMGSAASLRLRMERTFPGGNGRVYLIVVSATDAAGNTATACKSVIVPVFPAGAFIVSARVQGMQAEMFCQANGGAAPAGFTQILSFTTP